jgi:hypothetical protein
MLFNRTWKTLKHKVDATLSLKWPVLSKKHYLLVFLMTMICEAGLPLFIGHERDRCTRKSRRDSIEDFSIEVCLCRRFFSLSLSPSLVNDTTQERKMNCCCCVTEREN